MRNAHKADRKSPEKIVNLQTVDADNDSTRIQKGIELYPIPNMN